LMSSISAAPQFAQHMSASTTPPSSAALLIVPIY